MKVLLTSNNLLTNPEQYNTGWVTTRSEVTTNVSTAPDGTNTADKFAIVVDQAGSKELHRDYSLSSYTTFDGTGTRFDSATTTFDAGADFDTQTYTTSVFVKAAQYNQIRFNTLLDLSNQVFFDVDLLTGQTGTLFNTSNGSVTVLDHGAIPFGDGWYRVYLTIEFGFGFNTLRTRMIMRDSNGSQSFTGTSTNIEMDGFDGVNSPSIASNSYYGQSLAVGNGKIVVGAPYDDEAGLNGAGSIWISDDVTDPRSSQQRIVKSTAQANCYFGFSVAVGDNKIIAGAPLRIIVRDLMRVQCIFMIWMALMKLEFRNLLVQLTLLIIVIDLVIR